MWIYLFGPLLGELFGQVTPDASSSPSDQNHLLAQVFAPARQEPRQACADDVEQHLDREEQRATGSPEIHHHKFTAESSQLGLQRKSEERAGKCHLQPRWRLPEAEEKHWRRRAGPLHGALTYQPTCMTLSECVSDRSSRLSSGGGDAGRCERRALRSALLEPRALLSSSYPRPAFYHRL